MKHPDEFAELATLDPARTDVDIHSPQARATLERVLASDPAYDPRPRRTRRRLVRVAVATSAVAIAAAAVLVPRDGGPVPSGDVAYATWTGQPTGPTAKERADAVQQCRKSLKGLAYDAQLDRSGPAMVERRGEWALVIMSGRDQFEAYCVTNISPGHGYSSGYVGGDGRGPVGPRQVRPSVMGAGGGGGQRYLSQAIGRAGSDVVGMTYNSPTRGLVKASVQNGFFAFWVPGKEFDGLQPVPVRVTYRDGTTAAVNLILGS